MSDAGADAVRIVRLERGDDDALWDAYVGPRTQSLTDVAAWRDVVRDAYRISSHYFAARRGDTVVGALGLHEVRHPIFGHYLSTAIFSNDGGLYFDTSDARDALVAEARRLTEQTGASYLVIRTRQGALDGFRSDSHYRASVLDLHGGADAVWKALPAKTRNQVRRGQREGFTLSRGKDQLDAFFAVFHAHMRDLGSPAHSRRFYEAIAKHLGDRADFLVLRDGTELVAGAVLFRMNDTAMNFHTVARRQFNRRCPNYLLYWTMIEDACMQGCTSFDMGRSRVDSSNLDFKSKWNPTEVTLHYNFHLRTAKQLPDLDPRNPSFRLLIAMWQKLPLFVTRRLGPRLISGLA